MKYSDYIQRFFLVDMYKSESLKDKIFIAPEDINLYNWLEDMDEPNKISVFNWSFKILNNIENKIANRYLSNIIINNDNIINNLPNELVNIIKSFIEYSDYPKFKLKKSLDLITQLKIIQNDSNKNKI